MAARLRKLLGIGKLPDDLRAEIEPESILLLTEFIPATLRFSGQVPGRMSTGMRQSYAGALVLTDRRILATYSTVGRKTGRSLDQPWTSSRSGTAQATLSETGLVIEIPDLTRVDPAFRGHLSITYNESLDATALAQVPTRSLHFDATAAVVLRLVGL